MPATTAKKASTDTSSEARNRFVVSLPADIGEMIDTLGAKISDAMLTETGVAFEVSRAQVVQSLVRQALVDQDKRGLAEVPATA